VRDGDRVYIYERGDHPDNLARHALRLAQVLPIGDERRYGPTGA